MPFYKVMETAGAYTEGDILDIIDTELYAIISRTVPLQPVDPIAVNIENALYGVPGISTFPSAAAAADGVSVAEVLRYIQESQTAKIDDLATLGLSGVNNSLAYRIGEVERHFHSYERWFGLAGTPNAEVHRADAIAAGIAPFQIDAGNNTWGAWVQILGSGDTTAKFDLHRLMIVDVERDSAVHFVQIAGGTSGAQALTDGSYTEFVYKPQATNTEETPLAIQMRRQSAATKTWARVLAYGADTGTVDFYIGLHTYEG